MRMTVVIAMRRGEHVSALAVSELFKRERATEFTDGDLDRHALLLAYNGRPAQALPIFTALINRPTPHPTYNNRGYALLLMGEFERAILDFDRAIGLDPGHAFAHNNRGLAYLRLGKVANALVDITYSLQLDPDNAYAHRNLGIYYYEQGDWQSALTNLEQAARLGPNTPQLQEYLKLVKAKLAGLT